VKINHYLTARADDPFWLEIKYLGLKYKDGGTTILGPGISVLQVTEDQPVWPEVERLIAKYGLWDHAGAVYSKRDLDTAEWLTIVATNAQHYPEPGDLSYFEQTYDPSSCGRCGIHGEQVAPFRISGEPKAKTYEFLQLHWVYDEYFVRVPAQEGLTRAGITGVDFGPLLVSAKGAVSREAAQMNVRTTLPPALDTSGLQEITCMPNNEEGFEPGDASRRTLPYCGQVKYHHYLRGPLRFDRGALEGTLDVVKTAEWFGSGGSAERLVVVSQRFRQVVVAAKWRGLRFKPIELIG
jgi:hypothetical protein